MCTLRDSHGTHPVGPTIISSLQMKKKIDYYHLYQVREVSMFAAPEMEDEHNGRWSSLCVSCSEIHRKTQPNRFIDSRVPALWHVRLPTFPNLLILFQSKSYCPQDLDIVVPIFLQPPYVDNPCSSVRQPQHIHMT